MYNLSNSKRRPGLWLDNLPAHINTKILGYLDLQTRSLAQQTCQIFNHLVDKSTEKLHLDSFTIKQTPSSLEIFTNPKVFVKQIIKASEGYIVEYNGDITLKKTPCDKWLTEKMHNILKGISSFPNLTIKNLYFVQNRDKANIPWPEISFQNIRPLKVENVYLDCRHEVPYLQLVDPTTIRKIYIKNRFDEISRTDHWKHADGLVVLKLPFFLPRAINEVLKEFNFVVIYAQEVVGSNFIKAFKKTLRRRPDFREFKLRCPISYALHNEIRQQLGIHTHRHLGAPTVDHFPSDDDRQVSLTVSNDFIWFKGPSFVPGESDEAIEVPGYPKTVYKMDS
ncbi:hypothetical protein GCK72_011406 [Caenorhabditis remanei]|uniref:F-box domain-containing protein n=1 Tax=Caenorhabditis remanei TaxID=31234 RepID=A0A6A5H5P6_CAERE|nr:hypothetical protein GCK72_011406 [Caenorhabditis remanei]KAF1763140.1 hypothetical protein GCK72_011406 [Caenorhabditis remanei]